MDLIRLYCRKKLLNFLEHVAKNNDEINLPPQIFIETPISSLLSLVTDIVDYNNYGFQKLQPLITSEDLDERIESIISDLDLDRILNNKNKIPEFIIICVYICHPTFKSACTIVNHVECFLNSVNNQSFKAKIKFKHCIGFVPFYTRGILRLLNQKLSSLEIFPECYSINFFWVPLDETALSMEIKNTFIDFHVYKEESSLQLVAKSLYWLLRSSNSTCVPIFAVGSAAATVLEHLVISIKENKSINDDLKPFDWNSLNEVNLERSNIELKNGKISFNDSSEFTQRYIQEPDICEVFQSLEHNEDFPICFEKVIIIDRRCDMVTPFVTPFSYHALLDFLFGAQKTYVDIPSDKIPPDISEDTPYWRLQLFGDPLFSTLKDLRLKDVGMYLHKKAHELQTLYQEKEKLKDISEIGDFVRKLKGKQYEQGTIARHVNIATFLNEYFTKDHQTLNRLQLEDSIMSESPQFVSSVVREISTKFTEVVSFKNSEESSFDELIDQEGIEIEEVYRILCLSCVVENGFKNKRLFEQLKRHIISVFGFQEMYRLNILDRLGLLDMNLNIKSNWKTIKRSLNLFTDEEKSENDISSVYSGYAPISTRLVELLYDESNLSEDSRNTGLKEALNNIWGPTVELIPSQSNLNKGSSLLVVFVGGATLGEITTLKKLQGLINKDIYIATTEVINHKIFFESCKKPDNFVYKTKKNQV
ncbi:Sec1-family protein [Cryptosporidium ryanae]|uniref:Sec1-family protein n=1 Tax=Cryptosporidium ryanae TaxID=515981 RepID=UPI00351A7B25|nr:Sec1-family protein [Cryptosporidium ryanae]